MNYYINDTDYIGNHVFNFLREYLFDHQGEFYVTRYKNDYDKEIQCFNNSIKIDNKTISFPTPYGQYYCFYDNHQLEYFKNISKENPKKSIYILNLCESILNIIKRKPYEIHEETIIELPKKYDRLVGKTIFKVSGGFGDNITYYFLVMSQKDTFLVCNMRYSKRVSYHFMEVGQTNENLLKFPLPNLLSSPKLNAFKCPNIKKFRSRMINNLVSNGISGRLLNPITKINEKLVKIINQQKFSLIGIRFRYVQTKVIMSNRMCNGNTFSQLQHHIIPLKEFITKNKRFVLMIDDWRFLKLFILMFYDVIQKKKIYILKNVSVNDIPTLLRIGFDADSFYHTYSGFYTIIDRMKNKIGSDLSEPNNFRM